MTRRRTRKPAPALLPGDPSASVPARERAAERRDRDVAARTEASHAATETDDPLWGSIDEVSRRPAVRFGIATVLLGFFAITAVFGARTNTPTPDEFVYVPAGYYHLATGDLSFDPTNPPLLKMLMAAPLLAMDVRIDTDPRRRDNSTGWGPWIFGTSFMELNRETYLDAFFRARSVVIVLGLVLGALVFARARELLSPAGALAALALFATMPPVVAHSSVATLDIGVTLALFACLYAAAIFARTKAWPWAVATGAAFGFAFAIKGTAALFAPLVPIVVALDWNEWSGDGIRRLAIAGAAMAASAWIAVLASYGFSGFPLPAPLVEGLKFQIAASSAGEFPAFLFGAWSQTGWWYYYAAALALKTPIATLVLVVAGIAAMILRGARRADATWMLLPPVLLLYVLSFHYAKDYGVRYLLPAFPFLVLVAGRGADFLLRSGTAARAVLAALVLWQTAACAMTGPHQLAYFNELAGGPDRARRLLLDSNLDWGQDLGRLAFWLHGRGLNTACIGYFGHVSPKVYGVDFTLPPAAPAPGLCAISANFLGGYPYAITYAGDRIRGVRPGAWSWFDRLEPVARIGRSIYVYDVTAADVARLAGSAPAAAGVRP